MFSSIKEKDKLRVSILLNLILSITLIFVVFMYMDQYNTTECILGENDSLENKIVSIKLDHREELNIIDDKVNDISDEMRDLQLECNKLSDASLYTIEINKGLLVNIYDLEVANENLRNEINELSDKLAVYKKYDIYMYNVDRRTDCTYELLDYLHTLVEDDILNNVDFYCAFINAETNWINSYTKADTSRSGLAGLRNNTNKWVYELLLENGDESYTYDMIEDPYLSLKITKNYFYYLLNIYNGDLYKALNVIKDYNLTDEYIAKLDSYLNQYNTSLEKIAKETKEKYDNTISNKKSSSSNTRIFITTDDIG